MKIFRRFGKSVSLRVVNLLGLSVMFACLLLSYAYVKREYSYDRYNLNADRMVRLSFQFGEEPVDGRIYSEKLGGMTGQIPEVEEIVKMVKIHTGLLTYQGVPRVVNSFYFVSYNFFNVFTIPLIAGEDKNHVLQAPNQAVVSESFARQFFGGVEQAVGQEFQLTGRQFLDSVFFVSGVFEDIPATSHFYTDILLHAQETDDLWSYNYLLLKEHTNLPDLEPKILEYGRTIFGEKTRLRVHLMPLTDIHLHSRIVREMEPNGNIYYIYLIAGANVLLLLIVLFNLWLNTSLIFSFNRKYYQLLRLNGASSFTVVRDEGTLAALLACLAWLTGGGLAWCASSASGLLLELSRIDIIGLSLCFLLLILVVSLIPVVMHLSSTLFGYADEELKFGKTPYRNIQYMLTAQYTIVMMVVILAFGISRQMHLVRNVQVGGNDASILAMKEQAEPIKERYELLKKELLKHTGIQAVTASFQLPGDAIRDGIQVSRTDTLDWQVLPLLVVGEDFFPFFRIDPVAGTIFSPGKYSYKEEDTLLLDRLNHKKHTDYTEEYMINSKAMQALGFRTPEEAIGKKLMIESNVLDYIREGIICGVTDDFYYTALHDASIPMLIMQRKYFLHCILVRLDPDRFQESLAVFNRVWKDVNPDYPADYTFMKDIFNEKYRNELNAEKLVYIFTLLCLIIANLGLIIFMAFAIKRRTKEIGIRKVNGATAGSIIRMLNIEYIRWIILAFVIALPAGWYVMRLWLENFTCKISLDWWIFVLAGLSVLLVSVVSLSWQSWRAAVSNPVDSLKIE